MRPTSIIKLTVIFSFLFLTANSVQTQTDHSKNSNILIILDCSLSMRNVISGGSSRMKAAKHLIKKYIDKFPTENYAFMAFGSGSKLGCSDSKMFIHFNDKDKKEKIFEKLENINAFGSTPLAKSLRIAVTKLSNLPGYREVLLVSDGSDNCDEDVASVVELFNDKQIHLKIAMIHFNPKDKKRILPLKSVRHCTMVDIRDVPTYIQLFEILMPDRLKVKTVITPQREKKTEEIKPGNAEVKETKNETIKN